MEVSNSHHQAMAAHQLEQVLAGFNCPNKPLDPHQHQQQGQQQEKKVRPPNPPERALKCPRCESSNTKFCYYNNYSLSQPRYFCKGCRRYWTQGGSLRNVPVGGGCRKNKRSSSSSSSSSSSKNKPQSLTTTTANNSNSNPVLFRPPLSYDPSVDLSLPFTSNTPFLNPNPNPSAAAGFLDIFRGGGGFHQNGYSNNNALSSYYVDDQACADVLPPFEGANGFAGTTTSATAGEGSWINHGNNVAVDSTRGYWNGGVGSYWHGLINSSLM